MGVARHLEPQRLRRPRAGAGHHRVSIGQRGARPPLSSHPASYALARALAGGHAGDEPVLQLAVIGLVWLAALAGASSPVSAETLDADRLRLTTEQLDLVFALEGANPISWRACHPSCAAGNGRAVSISFAGAQDPPQARLRLPGAGTAIDLDRLRFTAETSETAKARVVIFQADMPVDGVRLVKSFAVSREGYDVILTVELRGANAAGRRLE